MKGTIITLALIMCLLGNLAVMHTWRDDDAPHDTIRVKPLKPLSLSESLTMFIKALYQKPPAEQQ